MLATLRLDPNGQVPKSISRGLHSNNGACCSCAPGEADDVSVSPVGVQARPSP